MACRWCGFFSKPGGACDVCGSPLPKDAPVVSAAVARDALITRAEPISVLEDHHPRAGLPSLDDLVLDARDIPEVVVEPPPLPREMPLPDVVTGEEQLIWSLEREPEGPDGAQVFFGEIARGWPVEALPDRDHLPGGSIPGVQDPFVEFDAAEPLDGPFVRREGPELRPPPIPWPPAVPEPRAPVSPEPIMVESSEPSFEIDLPLDLQPEPEVELGPSVPWPPAAPEPRPTLVASPGVPWPPAAPEPRREVRLPLDAFGLANFVEFDAEEPFRGPILRVPEPAPSIEPALESEMPEPQDYVGFEEGALWAGEPVEAVGERQTDAAEEAPPSAPLPRGAVLLELASLTAGDEMEPGADETQPVGRPTYGALRRAPYPEPEAAVEPEPKPTPEPTPEPTPDPKAAVAEPEVETPPEPPPDEAAGRAGKRTRCSKCKQPSERTLCEACRDALQELHALSVL